MRREELESALRERPFRPILLCTSDGGSYTITHPDLCLLLRRTAVIGFPASVSGTEGDRIATVDLVHVTRIETVSSPSSDTSGNGAAGSSHPL
jgi:hypothetical protein